MEEAFIRAVIYVAPLPILVYLISTARQIMKPNRVSVFMQVRYFVDETSNQLRTAYRRSELDQMFETVGLTQQGITPYRFRAVRDILFGLWLLFLHVKHYSSTDSAYPMAGVVLLIIGYLFFQLRKSFPIVFILGMVGKQYARRKNAEIFLLQQLILNEYSDSHSTKQNIYNLFIYLRKFVKHIRPAIDRFIEEYPLDPNNRERGFKSFADMVGTKEAQELSQILYQVDQSSAQDVQVILEKRYEELKKIRQQTYRAAMKDRDMVGYVVTFSGVMTVIICGLYIYFLEYKDMMANIYNFQ